MLKNIDINKVPLKYLISYNKKPDLYDVLYELTYYLISNNKDTFSEIEYNSKIKNIIISKKEDLNNLINENYIVSDKKNKKYKLLKNIWE